MTPTPLEGLLVLEPKIHGDERGYFFESFNQNTFESATGQRASFVQDNQSFSKKGVLRGLHFQRPPHAQGKLVRVLAGEIFDVAVDLRKSSPTFGKCFGVHLSSTNKKQMWIPEGFAHGFLTLSSEAEVFYKTTQFYHPESEGCLLWNDPTLPIEWPFHGTPTVSAKDEKGLTLEELKKNPLF